MKKVASFVGVLFIFLFYSCGEMGSIIPLSRMYQVSAMGESYSLDEYALIKQDEKIRPFFVQSIKNDPDIVSLAITLTAADGTQTGKQIRYVLDSSEDIYNQDGEDTGENSGILIHMERMDGTFPQFTLPSDIAPGPYVMTFQVFGRRGALVSKSEKNIYYLAREDYSITDISVHLPGITTPPHLIPPGTVVLLNAAVQSGGSLDPYIAWYNGKTRIGEGRVSQGANRLLWKLPSHTSFQNIRAEVVPFPPLPNNERSSEALARPDRLLLGKTREISLAVSSNVELTGTLSAFLNNIETSQHGIVVRNYQLAGTLGDLKNPLPINDLNRTVSPKPNEENPPRWLPAKEVYGLGTGPVDMYGLPFSLGPENKRLLFVLRLLAVNKGALLSVAFENPSAEFSFSLGDEGFSLITVTENQEEQIPLRLPLDENFITLLLDFSFQQNSLSLTLRESGDFSPQVEKVITLPNSQDIRGIFNLGGNGIFPVMILQGLSVVSFAQAE